MCDPWKVFNYEATMFRDLVAMLRDNDRMRDLPVPISKAIVESALLHTRQLCELLLSSGTRPDDINLSSLLPNIQLLRLSQLGHAYGKSKTPGSWCWTLNKILAQRWRSIGSILRFRSEDRCARSRSCPTLSSRGRSNPPFSADSHQGGYPRIRIGNSGDRATRSNQNPN
jgi:hypothetical protein